MGSTTAVIGVLAGLRELSAMHGWPAHAPAIRKASRRYFAEVCWLEAALSRSKWVRILLTVVTGRQLLLLGTRSTVEVGCAAYQGALIRIILLFHSLVGVRPFVFLVASAEGLGPIESLPRLLVCQSVEVFAIIRPNRLSIKLVQLFGLHDDLLSVLRVLLNLVLS